ncbi:MAG TPA: hypothetical protein VJ783_05220 [Pirellulales bacterium]|nr:hypothetical protein [Pirellulales bacterium]
MPSAALTHWRSDRLPRLNEVETHCATVAAFAPPNPAFLDEMLRGLVLHLSAHFQGFCRDLYTECSQKCIAAMPAGLQPAAQAQFSARLALEEGNPSHDNIKKDFSRFGFLLDLHLTNAQQVTNLGHLNAWRNKAAHQGTKPLAGSVPAVLSLPVLQNWISSCDGLAASLDGKMHIELFKMIGVAPWLTRERNNGHSKLELGRV